MPDTIASVIPVHDTFNIIDSSKLSTYLSCPRKYFYKYVLGWKSDRDIKSVHLVHGSAWHEAMEYLLVNGTSLDNLEGAYAKYLDYYSNIFAQVEWEALSPKNPARAKVALAAYIKRYESDDFTTIATEIAGSVPVGWRADESVRRIYFRMDSILQDNKTKLILSMDHKSAKSLGVSWVQQWILSTQMHTYLHALLCMYEPDTVKGIIISGVSFLKTKPSDMMRLDFTKTPDMITTWLWEINTLLSRLEFDMSCLEDSSPKDAVLTAFPRNPNSCSDYFGCPFLDYCNVWPNPLKRAEEPPSGMKRAYWNPMDPPTGGSIDKTVEHPDRLSKSTIELPIDKLSS